MSIDWQPPTDLPDLRRVGVIALDLETRDGGLLADRGSAWPWGDGYICGVGVAYRIEGTVRPHYFPLQHPDSQNFDRQQVFRWLQDLIAAGVRIVTQNGLYDWGWLRTDAGIKMPCSEQLEEIGALATMVDENRRQYRLEALCAWRNLPGKDETLLREGCAALGLIPKGRKKFNPQAHIHQLPARFVGPYAEQDPVSTLLLWESLSPVLDREGTRTAYRLEVDLLPMVHEMRRRGIRIDISAAEQARDLLLRKRDAVLAQISEKLDTGVGMDEINGRKWLIGTFDRLGIKYPRTEKGNPSFKRGKRGWMQHSSHWLPPLIATADQLDQYGNNFLQQQILNHIKNGRVYGEIHPHRSDHGGTRSLRFSYSNPPLQQMPKHDEELAPLIRGVFLPEESETWASCDYSQQEFRLVVHFAVRHKLAGATAARDRYISDPATDFHAYTSELTGGAIGRQDGKTVNFMTIYGAGPEAIALQIKKPLHETKAWLALYNEKMPFISQLSTACKRAAQRNGFFTLFNNARRHFNLWAPGGKWEEGAGACSREEAERRIHDPGHPWYGRQLWRAETYKALNALIQSAAAVHTKEWMRACFREGVIPLLQMHDSLDLSVTSPEQAKMVARLGEGIIKLEVPMLVDVKYGRAWGDASHTWEELHSKMSPHVELAVELPGEREQTQYEDRSDKAPDSDSGSKTNPNSESTPWEGDDAFSKELPHVCAYCHQPPNGTERLINDNTWLHPGCDDAYINARLVEEGIQAESPREIPPLMQHEQSSSVNGHDPIDGSAWRGDGSKTEAAHDDYAEKHADELFDDAFLRQQGYKLAHTFDYTLPDSTLLYQQNRYELKKGFMSGKRRPHKRFLPHHKVDWRDVLGAGDRRVIYNWPAIMRAGPGSSVFVTEGESNADALVDAGLLATTVLSHAWTPECATALAERHVIILQDHDKDGERIATDARRKLAPVAASTRIVPTAHLWKHLTQNRALKPGDDVQDWIKLGGDPQRLLDICRKIPAEGSIAANAYEVAVETSIPCWQWLYGRLLLRSEVTGTAAMGGTGKSTLSIVEALAMTSGRALLGEEVPKPLRVVLINLEDTRNTIDKRIAAAMRHYELTAADIGDRLTVISKGEVKIKVARQLRSGDVERNEQTIRALIRLVHKRQADVLSIDSFIRTHKVNENDNSAMQEVVECYEDIAVEGRCCVHLWHHTRKPGAGGEKIAIESARGASAFIDACRAVRVMEKMTAKEHADLRDIAPDMRPPGYYFRTFSGKRSFAPPADQSDWFEIENITLLNGDDVGVAAPWQYPANPAAVTSEVAERIIREIGKGVPDGQRFSNHGQAATARQAWPIVQKHCPDKTKDQCRRIVAGWIKQDLLYEDDYDDPVQRRRRRGLYAQQSSTEEEGKED